MATTNNVVRFTDRYKEPVGDHELLAMIEQGVANSVGDFLNSSDLARERQKATYEYGMMPQFHQCLLVHRSYKNVFNLHHL